MAGELCRLFIYVCGYGLPQETPPAGSLQDWIRPASPAAHLLGAYLRRTAEGKFQRLYADSKVEDQTRLVSAAGTTAGTSLISQLNVHGAGFADEAFTYAMQWRLGLLPPVQQACMNSHTGDSETTCAELLGQSNAHEVDCPVGPLSIQRHSFIA